MKEKCFIIETKYIPNNLHFISLRNLYIPIIGVISSTIYSLFLDFYFLNKNTKSFESFSSIINTLNIDYFELEISLKKLEAVGLIRTFERSDELKYIIILNEPLSVDHFKKNSFLYKQTINKIGELAFEKIEFSTKTFQLSKDEYREITTKYQDIFSLEKDDNNEKIKKQLLTTQEIPIKNIKSIDQAIKFLNSQQFINFISNEKISPNQLTTLQRILQSGLSNPSVNEIINYVFKINGKIVSNHIEKIANDLISKSIFNYENIKHELSNALNFKKNKNLSLAFEKNNNTTFQENLTWDEIFISLGGEL